MCLRLRGAKVFKIVPAGADTKSNTWGSGSLEVGDLSLLEDGGERNGALVSDAVVPETARDGCGDSV